MDVQNPYGYKTILFSDFVECIQYLGPINALGPEQGANEGDMASDDMLNRFATFVAHET